MFKTRVLFLCTGNSARSQMAEAFLRHYAGDHFEVHSAGLEPKGIHPFAFRVMEEIGIPLTGQRSKDVDEYVGRLHFGYVITVCSNADDKCPIFPDISQRLRWTFDDPAAFEGTDEDKLAKFREVRDQIGQRICGWLDEQNLHLNYGADQDMHTELFLPRQIVFEPVSAGGGSLWDGDNLLATFTVLKRTERHGRLSLRGTNDAYDLLCATSQQRVGYRMFQGQRQVASAAWTMDDPSAALRYRDQDYLATPESLLNVRGDRLLLMLTLSPGWSARQTELGVVGAANLPLIAFYLFVAYDLSQSASQSVESLSNAHFSDE